MHPPSHPARRLRDIFAWALRPRLPRASLSTSIAIPAPVDVVWHLVADPAAHLAWNPNLRGIEGSFATGRRFRMTLGAAGKGTITFRPRVLSRQENDHLTWRGRLWLPFLFDGTHSLRVAPDGKGGTVFTNEERFSGLLLAVIDVGRFRPDFDAANRGLKRLAEAQTP